MGRLRYARFGGATITFLAEEERWDVCAWKHGEIKQQCFHLLSPSQFPLRFEGTGRGWEGAAELSFVHF